MSGVPGRRWQKSAVRGMGPEPGAFGSEPPGAPHGYMGWAGRDNVEHLHSALNVIPVFIFIFAL